MAAVYNAAEGFLNTVNAESLLRSAEAAERAAEAYYGLVSNAEQFSAIMESAALGGFFGAGIVGGGDIFSADREVTNGVGSAENISFDIVGGIALVQQYYEALGAARAAVGAFADNTNGAYEITLSFGGVLGGMIAVALAAVGNSVIWLRDLCADTIAQIGGSAAVPAADLGQMWDSPLKKAAARVLWFASSALSAFGAVRESFGSVFGGDPLNVGSGTAEGSLAGVDPLCFAGGFIGDFLSVSRGQPIGSGAFFQNSYSSLNSGYLPPNRNSAVIAGSVTGGAAVGDYIPYDKAFAEGYMIGDILMRIAGGGGYSNTQINNANIDKISADVSGISENTGKAAAASEISGEDLKFLRDIAARDVINRFTTAEVNVSMGGVTNNLSGAADLDGIVDYLASGVKTALENAAEGVHS